MRKTSQTKDFPWKSSLVSYLYADETGIKEIGNDISHKEAYQNVINNKGNIAAIWPGKWRTDAFHVDNIEMFGEQFGCIKKELPITLIGYSHLTSDYDTKQSKYIDFYIQTKESPYRIPNFINRFSDLLKEEFGWEIAKSKGTGSHGFIQEDNLICFSCYVKESGSAKHWEPVRDVCGMTDDDLDKIIQHLNLEENETDAYGITV